MFQICQGLSELYYLITQGKSEIISKIQKVIVDFFLIHNFYSLIYY